VVSSSPVISCRLGEIDKSFVDGVALKAPDSAIVEAIIALDRNDDRRARERTHDSQDGHA
jgi:hypothetical protein